MVEKSVKEKVMEKKELILEELRDVVKQNVYLMYNRYIEADFKDFKDFEEYYEECKHASTLVFFHYLFKNWGFGCSDCNKGALTNWTRFNKVFTWKQFKALFYDDFVNIIDSEVKKYNNKEELEKSGFVSVRESILEAMKGYLEATIELNYQNFLAGAIRVEYEYEDNYNYMKISVEDFEEYYYYEVIPGYDDGKEELFSSIYHYVSINAPGGLMYIENIYDDYDEFKELYYDDYLDVLEKVVKEFNEQAKKDIGNEVYEEIENFLTSKTSLRYEYYNAEVVGETLSEIVKKTTELTKEEIKKYLEEIADKITDKVIEGKGEEYEISIKNSKNEVRIRIKNECCIEELMLIPA